MQNAVEETRRQLSFVENPVERLRLEIINGLKDDALADLNELVGQGVYFQDPSRNGDYTPLIGESKRRFEEPGGEPIVCLLKFRAYFVPAQLAKFFGWNRDESRKFVIKLIQKAIEIHPWNMSEEIASWAGSWEINALHRAYCMYVPAKHPIRPEVDRWLIEAWFQEAYFFGYVGDGWDKEWLGQSFAHLQCRNSEDRDYQQKTIRHWTARANAVVKRYTETGVTLDQAREVFYRWLEKWGPGSLNVDFVIAVANMDIFRWDDERRAKAIQPRLKEAIEHLCRGSKWYNPFVISELKKVGLKFTGEGEKLYRDGMAQLLAQGKIGAAHEINALVGQGLFGKTMTLDAVAAQAFDLAVAKGEFGIAAALVLQFGEDTCFDSDLLKVRAKAEGKNWKAILEQLTTERRTQIREAVGIAKTSQKPIRFDYGTFFLKRYC